ncbi:hypothetical protein SprV_0100347500 [Sparganum proliferum]
MVQLRDTVQSTVPAVLGHARRQHQDWFDDNDVAISNMLAEKNCLHKAHVNRPTDDSRAAFYRSRRLVQQRLREMKEAWTARKVEEIQGGTNADLDLPPSLHETIRALQQFSSGKAPGSDTLAAQTHKHGGPQLMDHLTALFNEMWRQGEVLQDFKDATIVHLYTRKGNNQLCDKHQGIFLLNIAGMIFARILLCRKASAASAAIMGSQTLSSTPANCMKSVRRRGPNSTLPSWI